MRIFSCACWVWLLYEYSWWTKYFLASNLLIQTSGHKMAALIAYFAWTLLSASFEQTEQALVDEKKKIFLFFASNLLVQTSGHKMAALRACSAWPLSSDSFEQTEQAIVDEVLFFFFFFFFFLLQIYWYRLLGTKWQLSEPILDTFQCQFWTNRTRNSFKNWCVYIFYFIHSNGVCDVPLVWFCLKKWQFYCH